MTGRGIDQVLPHPNDPLIHEPYMKRAREGKKFRTHVKLNKDNTLVLQWDYFN